jgi:UDP-N-acetylmuramate dehydrogenase
MNARNDALATVADALGDRAQRDVPLAPFTTLRVGGPAALLLRARTKRDLEDLAAATQAASARLPVLVIGQGSNLLVGDEGVPGVVVLLDGDFAGWTGDHAGADPAAHHYDTIDVTAGAAMKLPILARQSVRAGLTGLEWMVGVPGSVGGAVRMNAGGHGSDVAASITSATVFDVRAATVSSWSHAELGLAYRRSSLTDDHVVLDATFRLRHGDPDAGELELSEIVRWRREHQPGGANCGSVFTNPPGDSAGRLIDRAGCKGLRIGTASVSEKHANFIQADEGARASDVWPLIVEVRRRVHERFGVVLHPEVRTAGFDAVLPPLVPALAPVPPEESR